MASLTVSRWIAVSSILCSVVLSPEAAHAQQDESVLVAPNDKIIQSWQQSNLGGSAPVLKREEDGSTRLEWQGGISLDSYTNEVQSANGNVNSSLRPGTFYKNTVNSDLRAIHKDNSVEYFQLGLTNSDDLSVLSQNPDQINNIQIGRTGENYMLALGDIAPNFSSLSSSLGVRGLYGQREFRGMTAYGFAGLVTESWESLDSKVPSYQYIKDVHGIKVEKAFGSYLRTYATTQAYSERVPSNLAQTLWSTPGKSHSLSVGFQYQKEQFSVTGETAGSNYSDDGTSDRQGHATIVDGNWRGESVSLRAGHHDLASEFTSLSLAAQAGVLESYAGVDWTASSWVTLATDLRKSKNSTLSTASVASTFVDTDAVAVRANISFGPDHPGWAASLQQAEAQSINSASQGSYRSDFTSMLNYATPLWTAGLGYGEGKVTNEAWSASDSLNDSWSVNVGRTFSDASPDLPQTWSASINFSATSQAQRFLAGDQTSNTNYTVTFAGQRNGWGNVNFLVTTGETIQPYGAPNLRLRGFQLNAVHPFSAGSSIKIYLRSTERNIDDPTLSSREDVAGLQLTYSF